MSLKSVLVTAPNGAYSAATGLVAFYDTIHVRNPGAVPLRVRFDDPAVNGADADAFFDIGPKRSRRIRLAPHAVVNTVFVYGVGAEVAGVVIEARNATGEEYEVLDGIAGPEGPQGPAGAQGAQGPAGPQGAAAAASADSLLYLNAGAQTINDGATSAILWDAEAHDIGGIGNVTNGRFDILADGGYALGVQVQTSGKGGTLSLAVGGVAFASTVVPDGGTGQINITRSLSAGNQVTAVFANAGGSNTTVAAVSGGVMRSFMTCTRVR